MELLKMSKDNNEELMRFRKIDISNYIKALKSLICLRKMIINELSGEFYFGSKLNYKNKQGDPQTPDFITKLSNTAWIGELKRSLPEPKNFTSEEEYVEKIVEKLIEQLQKYDESFKELDSYQHDIILMTPSLATDAIGVLKFKYLEKENVNNLFKHNFALLLYTLESGANNTEFIYIKLDYGTITDKKATDILKVGYKKVLGELKEDLAKFKIYEESKQTPFEYVMVLLWTQIFPEIIKKSRVEKIIEWKDRKEHIFEVKLDELIEYLHKMYTLPSLSATDKKQFTTKIIQKAMTMFSKVKIKSERTRKLEPLVTYGEKDGSMVFRVVYKKLREKKELDFILKSIYLEQGEIEDKETQRELINYPRLDTWF